MATESSGIFKPLVKNIANIFCNFNSFYKIPEYQRSYDWEDEQIDKLWTDIFSAMEDNFDTYFLGPIILVENTKDNCYDVVDGQQRLTTLTILFCVVRDLYSDIFKGDNEQYLNYINDAIRSRNTNKQRLKLITHLDVQSQFEDKILNKVQFLDSEISKKELRKKKFINAAEIFRRNLKELEKENGEEDIINFIIFILNKVEMITISCSNEEYAIKLFEVLNTRGLNLSPADLIKSHLYSECTDNISKGKLISTWNQIKAISKNVDESITNLLTYHMYYLHGQNPKKSLYIILKMEFKGQDPNKVLFNFQKLSEYYQDEIMEIKSKLLYSFRYLPNQVFWKAILLTAKMEKFEDFIGLCIILRKFFYSYWIASYTTTKVKQTSFNIINWIKEKKPLDYIKKRIHEKMKKDDVFEKIDKNLQREVYGYSWLKPILLLIEYAQTDDSKINYIEKDRNLHSEHILPQEWNKNPEWLKYWDENEVGSYVNKLGNFTLLSGKKNISASNYSFKKKLEIYKGKGYSKTSAFEITKRILENNNWTKIEVEERERWLIESLNNILNLKEEISTVEISKTIKSKIDDEVENIENLTSINFIFNNIIKVLRLYTEFSSGKAKQHCHNILKRKIINDISELGKILKRENRKIIKPYIIDKIKDSDEYLNEILKCEKNHGDYFLNKSRIKRIVKDILPDSMLGYEANFSLLKYLQLWLEVQIIKAVENMNREEPWRKTIKLRDFH